MKNILIINNTKTIFKILTPISKNNNFDFFFAGNRNEGLEALKKNSISTVISHLIKSNIDDMELMFEIHEIYPNIPVIIIIPKTSAVKEEQFMKAGAFACINEGASANDILDYIEQAVMAY